MLAIAIVYQSTLDMRAFLKSETDLTSPNAEYENIHSFLHLFSSIFHKIINKRR